MQRGVQLAGVATLALVLVAATLVAIDSRGLQTDVLVEQQAQMQQLPEFSVAGTMQTGAPAPQGIPLSFQLPVPLPAPSPPAPTVITVGPRPKKAPVCKRCERQMRKIKVRPCAREGSLGVNSGGLGPGGRGVGRRKPASFGDRGASFAFCLRFVEDGAGICNFASDGLSRDIAAAIGLGSSHCAYDFLESWVFPLAASTPSG